MPNRDQFTTDIYVNGDQARDALAKLETELDKLRKQYANLNNIDSPSIINHLKQLRDSLLEPLMTGRIVMTEKQE